ncbi:MAG TPA: CDP-diacylglycerol--glycerol-3-phosphate 3-phosphatidyltransferase [Thermotogota bacterium]|nr:CDP-diacylglycerol--glycerol-3-phosphate 3-phosphatidyltransferase [Thermotogota bacterium]HPJ88100.1 CDP-diacylglycerol--glycerol-3-phosphate 3-phosphatidyltransferase [Thermotogota bacterium]HPR96040.1 CDP-diacylglycerol--glycerol-3-phosphate 3-phosphatidyltransferase [Thermotogota bacterium]
MTFNINTPTKITFIRVLAIPFLMWMISYGPGNTVCSIIALVIFLAGSFTDWLDGFLARKNNQITNLGKFADQLADKAFISSALCVLVYTQQVSFWLLALILFRDTAVSGIRMLAASKGDVIPANFWGKSKTVVQMVYVTAVLLGASVGWPNSLTLTVFAWITAFMTVMSGLTYFKGATKYLS